MRLPVEIHPYSAGLWAGLAGAVAMAVVACAFGLIVFGSIWYPINLLAAAALPSLASASPEKLAQFDGLALFVATLVHGLMSLLVGFLYAFLLPAMPRRPMFVGGVIAPLLWTGLVWASLGIVNPLLDARIHWRWFIASQVVFGLVAGFVVARTERIRTMQALPLAQRVGIEGGMRERRRRGAPVEGRARGPAAGVRPVLLLAGCDSLPGKPTPEERYVLPDAVMDFTALYGTNCSGCHGADGRLGPARPLNDPLYLALASDEDLTRVTAGGVTGTTMPAFAISAGGTLTDAQIAALVREMRARWGRPQEVAGVALPPYAAAPGDAQRGGAVFAASCASCHGADGKGGKARGSIVDGSYLALVSDQGLRSTVIAGRSDLGMPDFRGAPGATPLERRSRSPTWSPGWRRREPSFPGGPYPGSK